MEMLETKRWDGLCRIMTIVSTVTSLLTQAPKDSPLRSFWACARLFTNIYYSKLRLRVSHTVERHHLWNRNCAGDEEPWTRKATPVLARLEYKVLELLQKKKKKSSWIPIIAVDVEKWLSVSELQGEHVDLTQHWQPGPTAPEPSMNQE